MSIRANFRIFGRLFQLEHAAKIGDNFRTTKFSLNNFRIMCKILSRIKIIADSEGITIGAIERAIGASRGVISKAITKGTDIQSKWLGLICEKFPTYSPIWLLTGEGEMHRITPEHHSEPIDAKIIAQTTSPKLQVTPNDPLTDRLMAYIREKDIEIAKLNQEIGRLKARIEELERAGERYISPPQCVHTLETAPT